MLLTINMLSKLNCHRVGFPATIRGVYLEVKIITQRTDQSIIIDQSIIDESRVRSHICTINQWLLWNHVHDLLWQPRVTRSLVYRSHWYEFWYESKKDSITILLCFLKCEVFQIICVIVFRTSCFSTKVNPPCKISDVMIIISFLRIPHMHVSHLSVCRPYHEQFDTWLPSYNDQSSYMISLNITCHIANSVGWLEVSSWLFFFVHLFVWFFELYLVTHVFFQCIFRSFLLSSYCLDAYGSQPWPFHDKSAGKLFTTWRNTIRKLFLSST